MRWSDMDAYQHINNVAFLGYFETARVDLFFDQPTHDEETGLRRGIVVPAHIPARIPASRERLMALGVALADIHPSVEAAVNNQDLDGLMALYSPAAAM